MNDPQPYRLEVRWDFTGTQDEAIVEAHRVASLIGGEVTAVLDEEWYEVQDDPIHDPLCPLYGKNGQEGCNCGIYPQGDS